MDHKIVEANSLVFKLFDQRYTEDSEEIKTLKLKGTTLSVYLSEWNKLKASPNPQGRKADPTKPPYYKTEHVPTLIYPGEIKSSLRTPDWLFNAGKKGPPDYTFGVIRLNQLA